MQAVHAAQRLRHALAAPRHVALAPINSVPYPPPVLGFGAVSEAHEGAQKTVRARPQTAGIGYRATPAATTARLRAFADCGAAFASRAAPPLWCLAAAAPTQGRGESEGGRPGRTLGPPRVCGSRGHASCGPHRPSPTGAPAVRGTPSARGGRPECRRRWCHAPAGLGLGQRQGQGREPG
eukprot:scaffold37937_cov66-Phaeocystis_antarctica.AAC.2